MEKSRRLSAMGLFLGLALSARAQALLETRLIEARDLYGDGGVAADAAGNVYVVSTATGFEGRRSKNGKNLFGLIRYNPQGEKVWTRTWGEDEYDFARGVATGPDGSVYVVGRMVGAAIAKFDSAGVEKWNLHHKSDEHGKMDHSAFYCVAVDKAGNAYAAGYSSMDVDDSTYLGDGILLAKYSSDGRTAWKRRLEPSTSEADGIAVDGQGNIYVTGRSGQDWDGQKNHGQGDIFVLKCDPQGNRIWVRQYGGPRMDWGVYAALDTVGNILTVGYSARDRKDEYGGGCDVRLFKHDRNGNLIYAKSGGATYFGTNYHGFARSGDGGFYGTVDSLIEPAGKGKKRKGRFQEYLTKYGSDGEKTWSVPIGDANMHTGEGAAVDGGDFFYALGMRTDPRTQETFVSLMKFAPYAPSFDCAKASTVQEKLICSDRSLSRLDDTLSDVYSAALKKSPEGAEVKAEQIRWVKAERSLCATVEKLSDCMRARIAALRKGAGGK